MSNEEETNEEELSEASDVQEEAEEEDVAPEERTPEQALDDGKAWLAGLFERMNLEVEVDGRVDDGELRFDLGGDDANQLLGRAQSHPKALESVGLLLREIITDQVNRFELHVDVNGFRERRKENLESVAHNLADAARRIDRAIVVAGLNSFERRIVHHSLSEENDVRTESEGKGAFRKLRVEPGS